MLYNREGGGKFSDLSLDNPGNSSVLLELVEKMPVNPRMTSTNIDSQNHLE
jgi:hypothetical protein